MLGLAWQHDGDHSAPSFGAAVDWRVPIRPVKPIILLSSIAPTSPHRCLMGSKSVSRVGILWPIRWNIPRCTPLQLQCFSFQVARYVYCQSREVGASTNDLDNPLTSKLGPDARLAGIES